MAQTVSTTPRHHFYQANGDLAAGGTLEIFEANTITHATTWFDRDGAVAHQNANPLTLDSQGAAVVWLEAGKVYDWLARDALGNIIDNAKGITGSTSAITSSSQWIVTALLPTFVNTRTFTMVGDQTSTYKVGSRVRVTLAGGFKYGTIISSVFSTLTTVTVAFASASDVLDATISAVDIGLDDTANTAFLLGSGSVIDLTGYSGADVPLQIGQSAIYDVAAATTLLLRISTGDKQEYRIKYNPVYAAGTPAGNGVQLLPNNTTLTGITLEDFSGNQNVPAAAASAQTSFVLSVGFTINKMIAHVCTSTLGKSCISHYRASSNVGNYAGLMSSNCSEVVTAITSLGTLNFGNATTGRVIVTREI